MSNISAAIKTMIEQQLLRLHTCLLCTVLDVYEDGTAKVHPLTMLQTTAGEVRQHIALEHVPMTDQVRSFVRKGTLCVVVFAERDIAKALQGEYALPSVCRHHSLSDGIIIGTIGSEREETT